MAKSLLEESDVSVETTGKGRASVNVDKISESFSAGYTVDINSMKEKGLIGKDTLSVKVLAGGIIDKPLFVRANSFSAASVKMIALTGGHAYKTKTSRIRNKK
jgi:ribosomal protein L15